MAVAAAAAATVAALAEGKPHALVPSALSWRHSREPGSLPASAAGSAVTVGGASWALGSAGNCITPAMTTVVNATRGVHVRGEAGGEGLQACRGQAAAAARGAVATGRW